MTFYKSEDTLVATMDFENRGRLPRTFQPYAFPAINVGATPLRLVTRQRHSRRPRGQLGARRN